MEYSWKGVRITDGWQFGNGRGAEEPSETYVFNSTYTGAGRVFVG